MYELKLKINIRGIKYLKVYHRFVDCLHNRYRSNEFCEIRDLINYDNVQTPEFTVSD